MKVYLAAPYAARDKMLEIAEVLEAKGHPVTSKWITATHEIHTGTVDAAPDHTDDYLTLQATNDLLDIDEADAVLLFSASWAMGELELHRHQTLSGGRHVETGYALAKNKLVIVMGEKENIFHRGLCLQADTLEEALGILFNDNEDCDPS
jgi:nucleoside 2-deoxyribosyltransferase